MAEQESKIPVLNLIKAEEKLWQVTSEKKPIAEIHLDFRNRVKTVVFLNNDTAIQRRVKQLALSHATQYVRERPAMPSYLLENSPELELSEYTSDNLMDFAKIFDVIEEMDDEHLDTFLDQFANVVMSSGYVNLGEMFKDLCKKIQDAFGETIEVRVAHTHDEWANATFSIVNKNGKPPRQFKFWKSLSASGRDYFHITPPYHPVLHGYKEVGLINGNTNYYIRHSDKGVRQISCPPESATRERFGSSWEKTRHPFCAAGNSFTAEISRVICLSETGFAELFQMLVAALNEEKTYIAVSGGFNSPYEYPGNVLSRKRIPSPSPERHGAYNYRGSENSCVWEYKVLEQEGKLEKSHIPVWFLSENWLKVYEGEEPSR